MKLFARTLLFGAVVLLAGCETVRDVAMTPYDVTHHVAVGTYRVATAPVRAFQRHSDESTTAATTDTTASDVTQPGQAIPPEVASAPQQRSASVRESTQSASSSGPRVIRREPANPKPSSQRKVSSPQSAFPTA